MASEQKYEAEVKQQEITTEPYEHDVIDEKLKALDAGEHVQLKSEFDQLSMLQSVKTFKWSVIISAAAAFSAIFEGYQLQLTSSLIANKGFIQQFGVMGANGAYALYPPNVSAFGGLSSAGFVIGQFSINWIHGWLGRKGAMWTFLAILTIAIIVESVSSVWWHFALAKLVVGTGIGSVQATIPVYINEHAPVQVRGLLLVCYSLWFTLGGLICSIALTILNTNSPYDWKTPIYTQFAMIGAAGIMYIFLPETPSWLVGKGKMDQARKVLAKKNSNIPGYDVEKELAIIALTIEQQKIHEREMNAEGPFAIFKGLNRKRFFIGCWPKVLQQFVGLGVFSSYSTYFFQLAGNSNPFNVTVILGCVSLLAAILDACCVDKLGRRFMTLVGFCGACTGISLMAIVGCFDYTTPQLGSVLVFAGVIANFFNTFQSTTSYAYLTEMPEERLRARATGWGLAFCNLFATLFSFTIPLMLATWIVKTAFLFMGLGIPGTILAFFIMPESCGRSPAEIEEMFVDRVPLRRWKGYETNVQRDLKERMGRNEV